MPSHQHNKRAAEEIIYIYTHTNSSSSPRFAGSMLEHARYNCVSGYQRGHSWLSKAFFLSRTGLDMSRPTDIGKWLGRREREGRSKSRMSFQCRPIQGSKGVASGHVSIKEKSHHPLRIEGLQSNGEFSSTVLPPTEYCRTQYSCRQCFCFWHGYLGAKSCAHSLELRIQT